MGVTALSRTVEAASRRYFPEPAYLCSMVPAPQLQRHKYAGTGSRLIAEAILAVIRLNHMYVYLN